MKIIDVRTRMVSIPVEKSVIEQDIRSIGCVLIFIDTDKEVTGESLLFTFGTKRLDVLNSMVLSLKSLVIGENPDYTERIWQKLWKELGFFGNKGIYLFGLSAIDMACWDVVGKAAGKPLYKLFGAYRDEVPAYSSGLWLTQSIEELVVEARGFLSEGFRAMKMRIGKPRLEEDVERVRAVRQAVGPEVDLMVDANQRFTVEHAIRLGRKLEEFNLAWFEEPVPAYDIEGSARVAAALDVPIATGENEYTRYGFRHLLETKAADILMPDLARVGGFTELLKVAHMAEAYEVPISPHIFSEQSLQILGTIPNGTYLEYMPRFSPLYQEKLQFKDGWVVLPKRPGIGFTFSSDAMKSYGF
jgi:L-alanine-DL-glutamate epimerase-like enolase superfamily enzyme